MEVAFETRDDTQVVITVKDNGKGFSESSDIPRTSFGLSLIRECMDSLNTEGKK